MPATTRPTPARCDRDTYSRLAAWARSAADRLATGPLLAPGPRPPVPAALRHHPLLP
ncbi:hypothetical protein OG618_37250 (plasmid) [Kitasatospora sp. NBC_01246]|uniref:hypothetical protein n=1 Tax=Kitasatospora sp. NBC_01246 TaxID=2903570 RepID=UPI002E326964|nr:hypothetical protein [Kitasatospora sp. NBC_01246]